MYLSMQHAKTITFEDGRVQHKKTTNNSQSNAMFAQQFCFLVLNAMLIGKQNVSAGRYVGPPRRRPTIHAKAHKYCDRLLHTRATEGMRALSLAPLVRSAGPVQKGLADDVSLARRTAPDKQKRGDMHRHQLYVEC